MVILDLNVHTIVAPRMDGNTNLLWEPPLKRRLSRAVRKMRTRESLRVFWQFDYTAIPVYGYNSWLRDYHGKFQATHVKW